MPNPPDRHSPHNRGVFDPLPPAVVEAVAASPDDVPGFVLHLPVAARSLPHAKRLAYALVRSLAHIPEIDGGEVTVSEADNQAVHHRVFCDRLLVGRRRCLLRAGHDGACTADQQPPTSE